MLTRLGLTTALGAAVWWSGSHSGNPAAVLALISLWMFIWLCARVPGVLSRLYADQDLNALAVLPVPPENIFRWQLQKLRHPAAMSLVDLLVGLGVFGAVYDFGPGRWAALLLIALLSWVVFVALVLLCAARWPRLPYWIVPTLAVIVGLACVFGKEWIGRLLLPLLERWSLQINLLPTGWPVVQARLLVGEPEWLSLLWLIPIVTVIATIESSLALLRENYQFIETTFSEASDLIPEEFEPATAAAAPSPGSTLHLGASEIEEIIVSRLGFAGVKWHTEGWMEAILWNWLTPRERALAGFVFPGGFSIWKPWGKILRNLLVTLLATVASGWLAPGLQLWVLGLGLFVSLGPALMQILGTGTAFQTVQCAGVNIPMYAAYPIGYRELARLLIKCSLVQAPLMIVFTAISAVAVAHLAAWPLADGVILGIKAGGLLLIARLGTVPLGFSSGSNDSSRLRLRTLALVATVVCLGLAFLALAATSLLLPIAADGAAVVGWLTWGLVALAALDVYALLRIYGWFYHANQFDLMKAVP